MMSVQAVAARRHNAMRDIRRFLAENVDAFAINWMILKHAVSRLKSSNIGGGH